MLLNGEYGQVCARVQTALTGRWFATVLQSEATSWVSVSCPVNEVALERQADVPPTSKISSVYTEI